VSLVTLIVGETGKSSGSRARARRPAGEGAAAPRGGTLEAPPPGPVQWSCGWGEDGPGPVTPGCDGEPDLTLGLSPDDARSVQQGQLAPSVAFMQGRLKTSGDNELLLRVLAWTATPAFQASLAAWAGGHGQLNSPAAPQ
jgi:hypothetical protein